VELIVQPDAQDVVGEMGVRGDDASSKIKLCGLEFKLGWLGRREPDHANAYRHAVGSADVAVDRAASGRGQEPSQVRWRQLAMRQLGQGVQSEER
jgi:hypothetical protein